MIPTLLGDLRTNPYTVSNMTAAWNSLYAGTITTLPATHLYVKFTPQDLDEMELLRLTGEMLYDFPLEYEVLEMGDYYPQEGLGPTDMLEYYAVVEPGFQSPITGYLVLAELVIPRYDCYLTAEAFRRTGNEYIRYQRQTNGTWTQSSLPGGCQPGSAGYPECLLGDGTDPGSGELAIPCEPGSPTGQTAGYQPHQNFVIRNHNIMRVIAKNHIMKDIQLVVSRSRIQNWDYKEYGE